ncbi:cytosine deaminase-like metal-dependent hydrolase [Sphaerochaeta pleomorpha str. Grapes]|uniref:Cytosine deaminase-like metal-dependent hydrolase n=1 Tax=Sphaerochaeta pleomorpha (strain ATCC BAA-1885 / DSM 22778 / Grapes) TaxID=158190 RepID=G8QUJ3_SPHPG|nr:amidohydrolase family protein [Sphaerochaeta pleomorpha]AEV29226.1 cytosine deaminase-like metal-dependent hydrolase [Sphaerochaeta pleomorpha str. Grapes]
MPKRTVLEAKYVLTMDLSFRIYNPGFVVIQGNTIMEVGEGSFPFGPEDEVIQLGNRLLMPGLVNCHNHTPMVLTRGMCEGVSLFTMDGFLNTLRRYESFADGQMASLTTPISCAEMIRTGTTCFADQYFYTDKIFEQVEKSGLRGVLAYGIVELGDATSRERELVKCESFLEMAKDNSRITGWVGPHAFFVDNSLELIKREIALAKKYNSGFHIHFATSNEENDYCIPRFGCSAAQKMEEIGILDIPILAAHSITIGQEDIELLAKHPFFPVMAPSAAMRSGFPAAPVKAMREAGLTVVLGTDNVCNSNSYDMFGEMGTAGKLIIHREQDVKAITAQDLVMMATQGGAKALGKEHEIGSLEAGKKADIIALDLGDIGWGPLCGQDFYTQLVYSVSGLSVTHTMVDGVWLMKDKILQTLDMGQCSQDLEKATTELLRRMEQ